ncbi:MAG: CPBP family intramembrane metalloprotease, partial [Merismopedia sp. SIO2A8]|nr:CPBP family intramembrane metalloprotease [Merismopedia sp. SIO2A8]
MRSLSHLIPQSLSRQSSPIRVLAFVGVLALLWLPIYGATLLLIPNSNTASIVSMAVLFIEFLALNRWWNRVVYGRDRPWHRYGLQWSYGNLRSTLIGLILGLLSLFLLFVVQAILGWVRWYPFSFAPVIPQFRVVLEGFLVSIGVAFGEEMVFRGWLLDEIDRDYGPRIALWGTSVLFAGLHFIRPLAEVIRTFPQFPGLVLLGLMLVWAKRSHQNRLGISIGLHGGLVWGYYIVTVGE